MTNEKKKKVQTEFPIKFYAHAVNKNEVKSFIVRRLRFEGLKNIFFIKIKLFLFNDFI